MNRVRFQIECRNMKFDLDCDIVGGEFYINVESSKVEEFGILYLMNEIICNEHISPKDIDFINSVSYFKHGYPCFDCYNIQFIDTPEEFAQDPKTDLKILSNFSPFSTLSVSTHNQIEFKPTEGKQYVLVPVAKDNTSLLSHTEYNTKSDFILNPFSSIYRNSRIYSLCCIIIVSVGTILIISAEVIYEFFFRQM